ncbi:MAG: outer membrane beta-barrel protein [Agriterribacter sp.]
MKSFLLIALFIVCNGYLFAQTTSDTLTPVKKDWGKTQLSGRAADHIMIQFGYNGWSGETDSVRSRGFSRTFNMYFMYDFPFKSSPHFSAGVGVGIGTDNMFLKETTTDLRKSPLSLAHDTSINYKKYKLATGYLEIPLELRYTANPANFNKSFKVALGVKVGTMIDAHTKAKITSDNAGNGGYTLKIRDRRNFNSTRLAGTLRVGYGVFSIFGTYQFNPFVKDGYGPDIKPFSIGLCISGL